MVKEKFVIQQPPAHIEALYKGHKISLTISIPIDMFNRGMSTFEKCYGDKVASYTTSQVFTWLIHQGIVRLMELFPEAFKKKELFKEP